LFYFTEGLFNDVLAVLLNSRTIVDEDMNNNVLFETIKGIEDTNVPLNISVVTWNLAEKELQMDTGIFLEDFITSDIIVLGVQECEDIRPRRKEGRRSRAWNKIQRNILLKSNYECVAKHKMGGIQLSLYCKKKLSKRIKGFTVLEVACGIGNVLHNKGAVCILLRFKNKTIAFINAHLAAHQKNVR
jgi:phosphatidylinositol-bisphosphatase